MSETRPQWGSRAGFILAAAGSAVGLGNIWKFPYITGENGGGLFVIIYLVCIALVGIPIMMSEIMIGRAAQRQPIAAFHAIAGKRTGWAVVGWVGVLAGFIILSYYIVVAGWAMDYTLKSVVNFTAPIHEEAEDEAAKFRATASLDDMRLMLVKDDVDRAVRADKSRIRSKAKPSVWREHERFVAAIGVAGAARARARLLSDPEVRERVERAEALEQEIDELREAARAEAAQSYAQMPEEELLEQAETLKRRQLTFKRTESTFLALAMDGWTCTLWSVVFMSITVLIVAGGIARGIERTCRILMPSLFVLILIMVIFGAFKPGFGEALSFVFKPDPSRLKASGVLEALGHAFFTLSLGMGAMITYGSYQRTKRQLAGQSVTIALLDTTVALLACLMIFPIIFSYGQEPAGGPGLVFISMPLAFAEIGRGGMLLAILFFGLVGFAALTSSISLLEVVASYFIDAWGWTRRRAAVSVGAVILAFGVLSAFSMDPNFAMDGWEPSFGKNFFDTMDYLASNWMLPLGGLLIAIYAGWVMPKRMRDAEMEGLAPALIAGWLVLVRFVAPALVIVVLLQKVGILDADELFHGLFN